MKRIQAVLPKFVTLLGLIPLPGAAQAPAFHFRPGTGTLAAPVPDTQFATRLATGMLSLDRLGKAPRTNGSIKKYFTEQYRRLNESRLPGASLDVGEWSSPGAESGPLSNANNEVNLRRSRVYASSNLTDRIDGILQLGNKATAVQRKEARLLFELLDVRAQLEVVTDPQRRELQRGLVLLLSRIDGKRYADNGSW